MIGIKHLLSKSTFLSGKQCEKKLYLYKKHRELARARTESEEAIMAQGTSMGELAQLVFPNGKDATPEYYWNYAPSIEQTKAWIDADETTIYEAAFQAHQVMAALDILHHKDGKRIAIEVKSSTAVKEYHLDDAALQYWVMKEAGFAPDSFYIMHIDTTYVKEGKIKLRKFFHLEDVTEEVLARQATVAEVVPKLKAVLAQDEIPKKEIGPHCSDPFSCEFMEHCWQHIPENSVFELSRIGKKALDYYEKGIVSIADLPEEDSFSDYQTLQIEGVKKGNEKIENLPISEFLNSWEYPLYFFDFETINPALPLYDGSRPYQQLGVQYSLHKLEKDGSIIHTECLPDNDGDPRIALVKQMIDDLGKSGSIVAYNMGFEKGVIKSLAESFPEYAEQLNALIDRFVDLLIPFQKGWYYSPAMKGSASIKSVLPALFPNDSDLDYKSLRIGNGGDASVYLQAYYEGRVKESDVESLRKDLLAYCKLDTLAMVKIYQKLMLL